MSAVAVVRSAGKAEPWRYAGRPYRSMAGVMPMTPDPKRPGWFARLLRALFG